MVHRSDHLVVAGEQGFHQTALIIRAERWTYRTHRHTALISLIVHNKISQRVTDVGWTTFIVDMESRNWSAILRWAPALAHTTTNFIFVSLWLRWVWHVTVASWRSWCPQTFQHRNWNHSWGEEELWFTGQTCPRVTDGNPRPFAVARGDGLSEERKNRGELSDVRGRQADEWMAFQTGDKLTVPNAPWSARVLWSDVFLYKSLGRI